MTTTENIAATNIDIAELAAELGIRKALSRYTRGVDRGDRAMIASAYWPDGHDDHGNFKGAPGDFANYISDRFDTTPRVGQHHITNIFSVIKGSTAHVESYFIAYNPQVADAGGEHDLVTGRYLDRFEAREGEWRIASRTVVIDIARNSLAGDPWPRLDAFAQGQHGEPDPSTAFFA
jgi:hypothetical protein